MRLESDFRDYYDHFFDGSGKTFSRKSKDFGLDKFEQFELLKAAGYFIPPVGKAEDLLDKYWEQEGQRISEIVLYVDKMAHCGEGKVVVSKKDIGNMHLGMGGYPLKVQTMRDCFSSAFLGNSRTRPSVSIRKLQIGRNVFWIEYKSNESWMSNVGDGDIRAIGVERDFGYSDQIEYPLFAIDFVIGKEMYAIDLNVSPGIKGTGVEDFISGKEVVAEIKEWFLEKGLRQDE